MPAIRFRIRTIMAAIALVALSMTLVLALRSDPALTVLYLSVFVILWVIWWPQLHPATQRTPATAQRLASRSEPGEPKEV